MTKRRFKTAFILGAGLGTRLRPLTERRPKPLLPVGGRPVITYGMDLLIEAGVDRIIVNTHHCPGVYVEEFPDLAWRGTPITFRYEPVLLDTAGGLKNIEDLLVGDEAIVCYNGDIVADFPLAILLSAHERERPDVTLALRSDGPLLNVEVTGDGEVCDLRGSLGVRGAKTCLFTGIYAVETSFLRFLSPGRVESIVPAFVRRIAEAPGAVRAVVIDEGAWDDVGSVEAYQALEAARHRDAGS